LEFIVKRCDFGAKHSSFDDAAKGCDAKSALPLLRLKRGGFGGRR
jgi:hypothetical protein